MPILILTFALIALISSVTYSSFNSFLDSYVKGAEYQIYAQEYRFYYVNQEMKQQFLGDEEDFEEEEEISLTDESTEELAPPTPPTDSKKGKGSFSGQSSSEDPEDSDINPKSSKKKSGPKTGSDITRLNGKLPLKALLDPNNSDGPSQQLIRKILKNLILELYGQSPFFLRLQQQMPTLEEELIAALIEKGKERWKEHPLKKANDLFHLEVGDALFQMTYYKMIKGSPLNLSEKTVLKSYPGLTDFLTLDQGKKLSLYKAEVALLKAIFEEDAIVAAIIEERNRIYKKVSRDSTLKRAESKAFEEFFQKRQLVPPVPLFDFQVNTSRPPQG